AWHRVVGGDASLFDQEPQRAPSAATGNNCMSGSLVALALRTFIDVQVLQNALSVDEFGELLDTCLADGLPNIQRRQAQVADRNESKLRGRCFSRHDDLLEAGLPRGPPITARAALKRRTTGSWNKWRRATRVATRR